LHRWLGLFIGGWFALVGLSGSILVFEDQVDAFLNPHLLTEPRGGVPLPPQAMLVRVAEEFPLARTERIRLPPHSNARGEVYRMTVRVAPHLRTGSPRIEAMFSPVSGELLGVREAETIGVTRPY
jgi:uncharacterized iron-regulated membrane protein